MFTSRAEYRLTLRADNADRRLTERGIALGIVGSRRETSFAAKMQALNAAKDAAKSLSLTPTEGIRHGLSLNRDGQRRSAFELLAYPEIGWADVARIWPQLAEVPPAIAEHVEIDAKYDVYLARQAADVSAFRRDEALVLTGVDYAEVPGLSNEARQKLQTAQPRTIGQAARIEAMTPAALGILAAYLRRQSRHRRDAKAG
jgi:tRNA uridine 5-carboxymethylaminomethyl modification enzyme